MAKTYFTKLTQYGAAQLALATAGGAPIQLTHMAVGDGAGSAVTPIDTQTQLAGETYRAAINSLDVYQSRPNQIIAELIIPAEFGGWVMREAGLYDANGNLFAVANTPPTPKVSIDEGSPSVQVVRILIEVSSTDSFELITDMTVVIATRDYVANAVAKGNTAHGWGNHAAAGYIKSYIDTKYTASTGLSLVDTAFSIKYGTTQGTAAQGNDPRFSALGGLGREHTANAVFTGADNKISMTGIVSKLGLEVGDVIVFSNASAQNSKARTVESITDDNNIIVNYEHCGARGNGSLKLANETKAGATAKLLAKWFNAADGLGQDWVDVTAHRAVGTNYTINVSRTVSVKIYSEDKITNKKTSLELALNGVKLDGDSVGSYSGASWSRQLSVGGDVSCGSFYSFSINDLLIEKISELR